MIDPATSGTAGTHAFARGALIDCVDDAIVVLDAERNIVYANRAARRLTDSDAATLGEVGALIHPDDTTIAFEALERSMRSTRTVVRIRLVLPDEVRPVEVSLTNHLDTPGINGVVACFRNLTDEAALRESLERQRQLDQHVQIALTDELTGLPNRRLFIERLEQALAAESARIAVYFVDLDDFKAINDALGHAAGDAMLRSTARRLLDACNRPDHWGRLGGDEFVLFMDHVDDATTRRLADRLRDCLRQPLVLGGRTCHSTGSVGVVVVDSNITATEAVRRADIAMYEGKRNARGRVTMFQPEMEARVVVRAELEGQLRGILIGTGPTVVLQPIVEIATGHVVAVEALARWHSPTMGPIPPDRFIAIAEQIGVIEQLDQHVMRKACWMARDIVDPVSGMQPKVTVNISTLHLTRDHFARNVLRIAESTGFDPARLVLEVTESIGVNYDDALAEQFTTLRNEGIEIALDDFGTGQSSLAQLETLAVDYLKVDRSFLIGIAESARRTRYVETIVDMAAALDLKLVFEGVETVEQFRILNALGVGYVQGFLFGQPAGIDAIDDEIMRGHASWLAVTPASETRSVNKAVPAG